MLAFALSDYNKFDVHRFNRSFLVFQTLQKTIQFGVVLLYHHVWCLLGTEMSYESLDRPHHRAVEVVFFAAL